MIFLRKQHWRRYLAVRITTALMFALAVPIASSQGLLTTFGNHADVNDISQILAELEALRAEKARVDTEIINLSQSTERASTRMKGYARSLYRLRRAGTLPLAGGFDALLSHSARLNRLERLVAEDLRSLSTLNARHEGLSARSASIGNKIAQHEQTMDTLQFGGSPSLRLPVDASLGATTHWDSLPSTDFSVTPPAEPPSDFEKQRGQLLCPLQSYASYHAAERPESEGPGLEFVTAPQSGVYASAGGRVAFADEYGSYGKIVILDHGERYYSVYGGLGSIEVSVGMQLPPGALVGKLAPHPRPGILFFELRRGTRALDPALWLDLSTP